MQENLFIDIPEGMSLPDFLISKLTREEAIALVRDLNDRLFPGTVITLRPAAPVNQPTVQPTVAENEIAAENAQEPQTVETSEVTKEAEVPESETIEEQVPVTETAPEAEAVTEPEVVPETETVAEPEAEMVAEQEAVTEVMPEAEAEPAVVPEAETVTEQEADPETVAEPETETASGDETATESGAETASEIEAVAEPEKVQEELINEPVPQPAPMPEQVAPQPVPQPAPIPEQVAPQPVPQPMPEQIAPQVAPQPVPQPVPQPMPIPEPQLAPHITQPIQPASIPEPLQFHHEPEQKSGLTEQLTSDALDRIIEADKSIPVIPTVPVEELSLDDLGKFEPRPHLVREKTGEKIYINKDEFKIGKSKIHADYSIDNNTAISRVHVVVIRRNGVCYMEDNNSTNGTFVDGNRLEPGREILLKANMHIILGDEGFTYLLRDEV